MLNLTNSLSSMDNIKLAEYKENVNREYRRCIKDNKGCHNQSEICIDKEFDLFQLLQKITTEQEKRKFPKKNKKGYKYNDNRKN